MDYDFDEMMCEWQAVSMEDAIWDRNAKDCWRKVPYKYRPENEQELTVGAPEVGTPELPF
jgi:hypothetical protein